MRTITITEDKLDKVLADVEILLEDVSSLVDQDEVAQKRLKEMKANPTLARSEEELNAYLKKRGVTVD